MFNLLVSTSGWEPNRDSINSSRVLEYTSIRMREKFMPGGVLDLPSVRELPTIFASETYSDGSQPHARLGTITSIKNGHGEYHLEYVLDPDIPPIPNATLEALAKELDIDITSTFAEFERAHWSIKEADLYKVLLKHHAAQPVKPRIFELSGQPAKDSLVAVMMPFDAKFNPVYDALKGAIAGAGMKTVRADDIWNHDHVIQDIVSLIEEAKYVICDLTNRNPNVFYEMGIAHMLGRNVIMVTQDRKDVPFDVAHIRYIHYLPNNEGILALQTEVLKRLDSLRVR